MTIEKKFLSKKESCELLNCSIKQLKKILENFGLKQYKLGNLIRFRVRDLIYYQTYQRE
jgi:hypothetical protein